MTALQFICEVFEDPACGPELIHESQNSNDEVSSCWTSFLQHITRWILLIGSKCILEHISSKESSHALATTEQHEEEFTSQHLARHMLEGAIQILLQTLGAGLALLHTSERDTGEFRRRIGLMSMPSDNVFEVCTTTIPSGGGDECFLQLCINVLAWYCRVNAVVDPASTEMHTLLPETAGLPDLDSLRSAVEPMTCQRNEIVNAILQLLGNLLIGSKELQDELRRRDGLLLVLQLSATDFTNPLRREWALMCVRNACGGNDANQEYINKITLQKVEVVNQGLRESGLSVDVDPVSGKVRFNHDSSK